MTEELNTLLKQTADEIIAVSAALDKKMEQWSDILARRGDAGNAEAAGFMNKPAENKALM